MIGERVLHRDRHLVGNQGQKLQVARRKRNGSQSGEAQQPQRAVPADQRDVTQRLHAFRFRQRVEAIGLAAEDTYRFAGSEYAGAGRVFIGGNQDLLPNQPFAVREIERVDTQLLAFAIRQRDAHTIALHDGTKAGRDGPQKIAQLQIRNDGVVHFEKQLQTIVLVLQRCLRDLRGLEIQRVVNGQRHLVGNQREKTHLFAAVGVGTLAGDARYCRCGGGRWSGEERTPIEIPSP